MYQLIALSVALVPVGVAEMARVRRAGRGRRGPVQLVIRHGDPWLAR
jgi:hypothetical protein